jgi:hypothetical protein
MHKIESTPFGDIFINISKNTTQEWQRTIDFLPFYSKLTQKIECLSSARQRASTGNRCHTGSGYKQVRVA